ncbi:MAG: histidine kinase dimerization/phospho-acceptor domain-containing protein [Desulfobacterales bacterium]|nr:histidine kinase dimerization/phospho-acceptor domain-containing protein [Desulfobacterales bacterium]
MKDVFSKERSVTEVELVSRDGRKTPYVLTSLSIEMDRQQWTVGIGLDITERKSMEEHLRKARDELELRVQERTTQLERRNRELQEFAFITSHDLSEPLRKIQTFGSLLEAKNPDCFDEQSREYVSRMTATANRMQEFLNALLSYSRIDREGQEFRDVKLDDVVREAVDDLELEIGLDALKAMMRGEAEVATVADVAFAIEYERGSTGVMRTLFRHKVPWLCL